MSDELSGRVALVTGGAGAIGSAIGRRLARAGALVVLADLDGERATRVAAALSQEGLRVVGDQVDVTSRASVDGLIQRIGAAQGGPDIAVNNAGLNRPGGILTQTEADWQAVLAVNLSGAFNVSQAVAGSMRDRGWGRLVNIASRTWVSGSIPAYTASKAGLVGLTRSMARELAPFGITVNAVAPGMLITPFTTQSRSPEEAEEKQAKMIAQTPLGRLALPEDVAAAVAFFASPEAGFVTGEVLHVAGGAQLAPP